MDLFYVLPRQREKVLNPIGAAQVWEPKAFDWQSCMLGNLSIFFFI